jgi:hypothetical protein
MDDKKRIAVIGINYYIGAARARQDDTKGQKK